jgi:VCBS repeat-containing protein
MPANATRLGLATVCVFLAVSVFGPGQASLEAQYPSGASYCAATNQVFWFVHASDTHVGTSGSTDSTNLNWLVTTGRSVIKPLFTVVTGDLTDSTNGNLFGYPNGPYQAEWDQYKSIVTAAHVTVDDYYDLPGNHDAYNDKYFAYYKANAVQGPVYAVAGQVAWTKALPGIGSYHFVGVNTADNTGAAFSLISPYGDHAGLDSTELAALSKDLVANLATSRLTFVFGHHPVTSTGNSSDTYLYYGAPDFIHTLDVYSASAYNYGHVHDNVETMFKGNSYTGTMTGGGIRYARVSSLGKDSPNSFSVVSVDCDGVNSVTQPVGTWPVVLITAPVNRYVGTASNPYAYTVPAAAADPIRALVFDPGNVSVVQFRVDGATWQPMSRVSGTASQWTGAWDASAVATGEHSIEVSATSGTATRSHVIKVWVAGTNRPPVAVNDTYTTASNAKLTVAAPGVLGNDSDPDGNPLTAQLQANPTKGTLTLNSNGSFTYTPNTGATGSDTFTYTASDGVAVSAPATVTITLTAAVDTVTITTATYTKKTTTLLVTATSSAAPSATLTVIDYNATMTYNSRTKVYSYQLKTKSAPVSVTVKSSAGGTATKTVTPK